MSPKAIAAAAKKKAVPKLASRPSGDRAEELSDVLPRSVKDDMAPTDRQRSTRAQQKAAQQARTNCLESNPHLPMDAIGMCEAATCQIHLNDDDPCDELLQNVDKVETLPQDPTVIAAIHRLLDPDSDLEDLKVQALQSEAVSPEERALPQFSQ